MDFEEPTDGQGMPPPIVGVPELDGERLGASSQLTQITRAMVSIYKEQFGRGPRFAHTHYAGPNAIVCFLEGTLTPVEKSLVGLGEHQRLRDIRLLFQHTAELECRVAVEEVMRRPVVAFISGIDVEGDVASEMFLLG
jgi:uncharacterized protein YbcI